MINVEERLIYSDVDRRYMFVSQLCYGQCGIQPVA